MPNVQFTDAYRDGANCKRVGHVVLTNRAALTVEDVETKLVENFDEGKFFIAHQVQVPEQFHWKTAPPSDATEADHPWHTFLSVCATDAAATDPRDLSEWLIEVERIGPKGWEAFDVLASGEPNTPPVAEK